MPIAEAIPTASAAASTESPLRALTTAMRSHPVVLLGEVHDNAAQHALRAQALQALLDTGARPALVMEQFDREHQAALDKVLARPDVSPASVIAAGAPGDPAMQGWNWSFYQPYIALAIRYRLPIVAANVSRDDTSRILQRGLQQTGFDASVPADIQAVQAQAIADGHCGLIDTAQAGRMTGAQVARDQFMARMIDAHRSRGVVLLAGNGHVRRDVGVPRWLPAALRADIVSIGLLEPDDPKAADYDLVVVTPAQPRPDPCQKLREHMKRLD